MPFALISPNEIVYDRNQKPPAPLGARVAQIADAEFDVAPPLFWVSCDTTIDIYEYYYDTTNQKFVVIPPYIPPPKSTTGPAVV